MGKIMLFDEAVVANRGGRMFVISDIHGNVDAFNNWMHNVQFSDKDYCIVLGDAIDRKEGGIALLKYFHSLPNNFAMLLGNHEEMFLNALAEKCKGIDNGSWYQCCIMNGGQATWDAFNSLPIEEKIELSNWLTSLPYVGILNTSDGKSIYLAHAGLNQKWLNEVRYGQLSKNDDDCTNITWAREEWWRTRNDLGSLLITGHTNSRTYGAEEGTPYFDAYNQRLVIDVATAKTNKIGYVVCANNRLSYTSC